MGIFKIFTFVRVFLKVLNFSMERLPSGKLNCKFISNWKLDMASRVTSGAWDILNSKTVLVQNLGKNYHTVCFYHLLPFATTTVQTV